MEYLSGGSSSEDTLQTNNILTPWFLPWANITNIPLLAFFLFFATAIVFGIIVEVCKHTQNQLVTGVIMIVLEAFCYKLGIYQLWMVIITGFLLLALIVFERKPAL
jgi:hypothetical protein